MKAQVEPYSFGPELLPVLDECEADSFALCRAVFAMRGTARKARDGFFYNDSGLRVVIHWLGDDSITENHIANDERTNDSDH